MYLWCPSQMCVLLLSCYNLLILQIWWTFMAVLRKGIQQGSLNLSDFTTAKFHRRTASLLIYYIVALILWPISAVVICLGFPGIAGHTFLRFCHWKKEGCKDEQLSPTLSFVGLCPGARLCMRRLLHFKEWSISHLWVAPKYPTVLWEGRKELGNSGDPFDSMQKPEIA